MVESLQRPDPVFLQCGYLARWLQVDDVIAPLTCLVDADIVEHAVLQSISSPFSEAGARSL